jgi:hypothetical protein
MIPEFYRQVRLIPREIKVLGLCRFFGQTDERPRFAWDWPGGVIFSPDFSTGIVDRIPLDFRLLASAVAGRIR